MTGEVFTRALHGSVLAHIPWLNAQVRSPWHSMAFVLAELRMSSFLMWFSRFSVTSKLHTLGPSSLCLQCRSSASKDIMDVHVPLNVGSSSRPSEHVRCCALRLLSHLLCLPQSDLAESCCGSSCNVSSESELLAAASGSADTRNPRHCSLWFFLYSVKVTEDGFARVPPLELQVRDMLNHRLR